MERYRLELVDARANGPRTVISGGRAFLAYGVAEADRRINTFLTRFPGGDGRWQVTKTGGAQPTFSRDYAAARAGGKRRELTQRTQNPPRGVLRSTEESAG